MMFQTLQIHVGGFDSNFSYLLINGNAAAIVDPCGDVSLIQAEWERHLRANSELVPTAILLTHTHPDHISGITAVKSFFDPPVYASENASVSGILPLRDGERLPFGDGFIECLATPGHSVDSMCFRTSDDSALFTGDTLFVGCCGFCRPNPMFVSLNRLKALSGSLMIYSGHDYGEVPYDSLEHQKKTNPYLTAVDFAEFRERLRLLL